MKPTVTSMSPEAASSADLSAVILDTPRPFRAHGRLMALYPVTLGKTLLLGSLLPELDVNEGLLLSNPMMEAVRLVGVSREACTAILAIHTCPNTRRAMHDWEGLESRKSQLSQLSDEDLATLLLLALTSDKTETLMHSLGLDEERKRMSKVHAVKDREGDGSSSLTFGGRSILGTFIGQLKEMGYDDDDIIYRRSYTYLRLMLADKLTSVYLTKEERSKLSEADGGTMIDGSDPGSVHRLSEWLAKRGMKMEEAAAPPSPAKND